jgi:hypothetical protein
MIDIDLYVCIFHWWFFTACGKRLLKKCTSNNGKRHEIRRKKRKESIGQWTKELFFCQTKLSLRAQNAHSQHHEINNFTTMHWSRRSCKHKWFGEKLINWDNIAAKHEFESGELTKILRAVNRIKAIKIITKHAPRHFFIRKYSLVREF